ncbi:hypothetical protein RBXJA2T_10641 [Rubrivivax benzoatilyticus JA2 = ATCC BAA-35]|nr:hypothetical protein RBXJA2T_10641 [Rubrivivax benzoatilyticus JA2 = ATCC BAA-35]
MKPSVYWFSPVRQALNCDKVLQILNLPRRTP